MSVHVLCTGGTITSHLERDEWRNLDGRTLIAELGDDVLGRVVVEDISAGPSSQLSVDDMVSIARRIEAALATGADGVVVVHGTDTLELTAFVAQLLLGTSPTRRPVVFTGSMRVHSHPQPDGPQNLRDSLAVAASPVAVGRDVLVCLDARLHAADRVVKRSAVSLDAFDSAPFEPVGRVSAGMVEFPSPGAAAHPAATGLGAEVALVTCYPGIDAGAVRAAVNGRRGLVVEGFGDLNLPRQLWAPLHEAAAAGVLVVVASRPFTPTTTGEGLDLLGAIGAGGLTAQKARLAAMAALDTAADRAGAAAFVAGYAVRHEPDERSAR